MGDSSQVLPLCACPHGLSLNTGMVSYEKCKRIRKAVVSVFMKIRLPFVGLICDFIPDGPVFDDYNRWWFMFNYAPFGCMVIGLWTFVYPGPLTVQIYLVAYYIYFVALYSVAYWHRDMPYRLVGSKLKFMMEFIPVVTLAALREFLEFSYGYLLVVIGCTTCIHVFALFCRRNYDVGIMDVILRVVMQVVVYTKSGELLVRAAAFSFCTGLCWYRYLTYCAPEVPVHRKKEELEQLPC